MLYRKTFSILRFFLLILCFAGAAGAAYFLADGLAAVRVFCMPAGRSLAACGGETALWLAASLSVCALPLWMVLSLWRGACFGLTLALAVEGMLTAPDMVPLAVYGAVTLVLCAFAAGAFPRPGVILRFLPCAGMVFGLMLLL